jgi:Pyruvate/2-oxoacid:ferredoxin oxidoreductase delta subunit
VAAEADAIINLPKFKTHGMTTLTGAVKNLFGCIPGKRKVQWHLNTGVDHGSFMRMLVELSGLLKSRFTIMDSIVGMEGNGPGSGDPRTMGVLLAGRDPVAVDSVAGRLVGLSPQEMPVIKAAAAAGIGETKAGNIQIVGDELSAFMVNGFRLPPREHPEWRMPEFLRKRLKEALTTRPVIDHGRCVRCGVCQKDCPQQAIAEQHDQVLAIDYRICIRCFCCQEFCPQGAITVGRGWMLKAFGK